MIDLLYLDIDDVIAQFEQGYADYQLEALVYASELVQWQKDEGWGYDFDLVDAVDKALWRELQSRKA